MDAEAERAYRQALELWQGNGESLNALNSMLWDRGDFDGAIAMLPPALDADPNNIGLWQMYFITEKRKELQGAIADGEESVAKNPASAADVQKLLELYASAGDTNKVSSLLGKSIPQFAQDAAFLRVAAEYAEVSGLTESELAAAEALVAFEPEIAENQLVLARAAMRNNKKTEFFSAARAAIEKGGLPMREALTKSSEFESMRSDPEFQAILDR
jgi:tetratricopeptide (TPR) repeat protein